MITIPQCNPGANTARHRPAILRVIKEVIDGGRYIMGGACQAFESAFAEYNGVTSCIGVANGTDAIELILRALGVGHGDCVATVANTAVATVAAIGRAGASPRFADIDAATFNMCSRSLSQLLDKERRIKAVVVVHLFGHPANIGEILLIAKRYGIPVIEDCAQAHGAMVGGRKVGSFGVAGAYSFYPTKNLGALGDGGAVITSDLTLADRVQMLRQYGWRERYVSEIQGINSRLDEVQAAILLAKLPHLDSENEKRREVASLYRQQLFGASDSQFPIEQQGVKHVYHQFVLRVKLREIVVQRLKELDVGTAVHYPMPIHRQPAYRDVPLAVPLTVTDEVQGEILSLPMFPELSQKQIKTVIASVKRVLA